jgi:hypothetical protein
VDSNQLDIALAIPLVKLIIRNEPGIPTSNDADIWRTVFELIIRTNSPTHRLPSSRPSSIRHYDPARLSRGGLNRHIMRSTNELLRNSQDAFTIILEGSTNDTLRKRTSRTTQGISIKSPEPNMQKITGAVGRNLHFKILFSNGL